MKKEHKALISKEFGYKQVIVMRKDIGMSPGKAATQAAHASTMPIMNLYQQAYRDALDIRMAQWNANNFKKVVLSVNSLEELLIIQSQLFEAGISAKLITDSGLTEFDGPTITALGTEPVSAEEVDPITKNLKLF